ncbi:MAG: DEAD/DEAH box helicase [Spirochaetaceae bacterium]
MTTKDFASLGLTERTLSAVQAAGYTIPTEVQERTIPELLAGRDVLATAQTGTGKTAAFVLPLVQTLIKDVRPSGRKSGASAVARPKALVLTPTRELAAQVQESIVTYGRGSGIHSVPIFGGASKNKQMTLLAQRPDVLVATPGRLLDFMSEGRIDLAAVSYLVLDEADRMLDMGFIPDVRRIVSKVSENRQTALFSATMPPAIAGLAKELLKTPVRVAAEAGQVRVERIDQSVMYVDQGNKISLLPELIHDRQMYKVLVFTRTKHRARKVAKVLEKHDLTCDSIHGDKSQGARNRALADFKNGKTRVLVATDVASRGLDVDDVTHVVNFELPNEAETYVHRIGRTARAGADGIAISFCDAAERPHLRDIEQLIGAKLAVDKTHGYPTTGPQIPDERSGNRGVRHASPRQPGPRQGGSRPGAPRGTVGAGGGPSGARRPRFGR